MDRDRPTYLLIYLLTYLLTYSMEQSPSWEGNWFCSWSRNSPHLWNPKIHYRTHKCPPLFFLCLLRDTPPRNTPPPEIRAGE
jgi:hypothetical protein